MLSNLWQEWLQALRLLTRSRSFLALAVVTLALGIGAGTSTFSIVQAVLLRPLPYEDPDRLVHIWRADTRYEARQHGLLTKGYLDRLSADAKAFENISILELWDGGKSARMDLFHPQGAERLRGSFATPDFFQTLGVTAEIGRLLGPADQGRDVAVLSRGFWQRRFGGDPSIVGQTVSLMSGRPRTVRPFTVVGILPPEFHFTYPDETEVWVPLSWPADVPDRAILYMAVARLKPGISLDQAQQDATQRMHDLVRTYYPSDSERTQSILDRRAANVELLSEHVEHESRTGVLLLGAVSLLVFLIACINVALLVLARSVDRAREIALRTALGASTLRVVRSLLAEGVLIAAGGCAAGILLAHLSLPLIRGLLPAAIPRADEIAIDLQVLGFALAAGALTAIFCALAGLSYVLRADVGTVLGRSGSNSTGSRPVVRLRRLVMGFQVAVVVLLLTGAWLFLHSYWNLRQVDLGYRPQGVITMQMRLLNPKYRQEGRIARFQEEVLASVRALPGIERASITTSVPFRGVDFTRSLFLEDGSRLGYRNRSVDPGYFELMGIPLLRGRSFNQRDTAQGRQVAILSESFARSLFGDQDPVGQEVVVQEERPGYWPEIRVEVVGIVGDVRTSGLTEPPPPALYRPRKQEPNELICLVVIPSSEAGNMVGRVRETIHSIDPEQPVEQVAWLDEIVAATTVHERFYTTATVAFALAALILAMVGLVGTVARSVSERRREIAIRMALGSKPEGAVGLILRDGLLAVAAGVAVGLAVSAGVSQYLRHLLFQITPLDPLSYGAAALLVLAASVLAAYIPASRSAQVDPMSVLKTE